MNTRDVIFISHKSPNDNYFAAWLASKLKLLGYEVWLDVDELKSGDAFWPKIEDVIRNRSAKFLVVVSNTYLQNINDPISGVFKELATADRVKGNDKFKVPVKIDNISDDDFPVQLMGLNSINFNENWQSGLEKLLDSFQKEQIPVQGIDNNPLNFWLDSFKITKIHTQGPERIYTNWFPFQLPQKIYIHTPVIQNAIDLIDIPYSYLEYSDRHICFFPATCYPESIKSSSSFELLIDDILNQQIIPIDDFLTLNEPRKKIIELVNKTFSEFLFQLRLKKYEQAKSFIYYYPSTSDNRKRISLKVLEKTNVAVTGKIGENLWSFAISSFTILHPSPILRINSHIIFESKEFKLLDETEQHRLRRTFASNWYNRDWLDTLIGMMIKISGSDIDGKIRISINPEEDLIIDTIPLAVETNFGYVEPEKEEKEND